LNAIYLIYFCHAKTIQPYIISAIYKLILHNRNRNYHLLGDFCLANLIFLTEFESYSPFCVTAIVTKLIGPSLPLFLSPMNLVIFAGTQNGE
jgi:hypothetical protein